jgi:hypothetical protein
VTGPRTVTVPTLDHGDVTLPEPAWCIGHDPRPEYRADIGHRGPDIEIGTAGEPLFIATLTQHPFGGGDHQIGLHVDPVDITSTYTPAELDQLAAGLVEAAAQLRHQARWLTILRATQDGAR